MHTFLGCVAKKTTQMAVAGRLSQREEGAFRHLVGDNAPVFTFGHNHDLYAGELFFDEREDDMAALDHKYDDMSRMYFRLNARVSEPPPAHVQPASMHAFRYNCWVSRLFFGQCWLGKTITHETITDVMNDPEELAQCMQRRRDYKQEFLGGRTRRNLDLPFGIWVVSRDIDMPFLIPVDLHWFNGESVDPNRATWQEMQQAGRLVGANEALYRSNQTYAPLLKRLLQLERHLVFDYEMYGRTAAETNSLWWFWHEKKRFVWYRPAHLTVITHLPILGWSAFLAVPRATVERNLDKYIIPRGAIAATFAGEVRVLDVFATDRFAVSYIGKIDRSRKGDLHATHIVCTKTEIPRVPAVASIAFFSNHRCTATRPTAEERGKERPCWFINAPNSLVPFDRTPYGLRMKEKATCNVVYQGSEIYRHSTTVTACSITGREFLKEHNRLFSHAKARNEWIMDQLGSITDGALTYYYVAIEWNYCSMSNIFAVSERVKSSCLCLSRCHFLDPTKRRVAPFLLNDAVMPRPALSEPWTLQNYKERLQGRPPNLVQTVRRYLLQFQPQRAPGARTEMRRRQKWEQPTEERPVPLKPPRQPRPRYVYTDRIKQQQKCQRQRYTALARQQRVLEQAALHTEDDADTDDIKKKPRFYFTRDDVLQVWRQASEDADEPPALSEIPPSSPSSLAGGGVVVTKRQIAAVWHRLLADENRRQAVRLKKQQRKQRALALASSSSL